MLATRAFDFCTGAKAAHRVLKSATLVIAPGDRRVATSPQPNGGFKTTKLRAPPSGSSPAVAAIERAGKKSDHGAQRLSAAHCRS